ncbi:hypothetical protein AC579_378 [Pseudocercospora musae]|uniref:Histone chaperone domain-containing protein n=1 Tax=Pseudocercospora musae TaxID=113226 RepID=A0A139ICZ0_9PEZI|nr:hypothetical protein AC579_378 [Pseudocercospora musae]
MGNSVQVPTADEGAKAADTPMDSSMEKGKGKAPVAEPMDEDEEDSNSEEEPEEADEDNMEEIDMDNIVGSRTRGKNIDFAEAAKNMVEDDEDEEDDDEDFQDDDAMVGTTSAREDSVCYMRRIMFYVGHKRSSAFTSQESRILANCDAGGLRIPSSPVYCATSADTPDLRPRRQSLV